MVFIVMYAYFIFKRLNSFIHEKLDAFFLTICEIFIANVNRDLQKYELCDSETI